MTCSIRSMSVELGYLSSRTLLSSSPAITARASMRFIASSSQQPAQGAEIQVQVLLGEPELLAQLSHALVELHEGPAEPLLLLVAQAAAVDAAQSLALHQLA